MPVPTVIPRNRPISVAFYDAHGDTEDLFLSYRPAGCHGENPLCPKSPSARGLVACLPVRLLFKASAHSFKQFTSRLLKLSFSLSMHIYNSDGRHA